MKVSKEPMVAWMDRTDGKYFLGLMCTPPSPFKYPNTFMQLLHDDVASCRPVHVAVNFLIMSVTVSSFLGS